MRPLRESLQPRRLGSNERLHRRFHVSIFDVNAIEAAEPRHSSSDSASIRLKTATVARQSPFIAAAPASP
jgi:hypothetical protein